MFVARVGIALCVVGVSCGFAGERSEERQAYGELLRQFAVEKPGYGPDSHFKEDSDQAMTYGLVLWAESIRYAKEPTEDGAARIRAAVAWLQENRDLDGDGHPGWGLPKAYDTWGDGSINPTHTPYTITTALCLLGLIEAGTAVDFWNAEDDAERNALVSETLLHWNRTAWTSGYGGGYYWYSPNPNDRIYCVNPSSMMLAAMVEALSRQPELFDDDERRFLESRADETLKALIVTVQMREGAPYWKYAPLPNDFGHDAPNDAVHQAYTLWGIEAYRDHFDRVEIPWSRAQSVESVTRYERDGKPYSLPQDLEENRKTARMDRLWGRGMVLAFYSQWGERAQAKQVLSQLKLHYGTWPQLKQWPTDDAGVPFYARHASHVLVGLAMLAYQ